jgi:hypothetical protein
MMTTAPTSQMIRFMRSVLACAERVEKAGPTGAAHASPIPQQFAPAWGKTLCAGEQCRAFFLTTGSLHRRSVPLAWLWTAFGKPSLDTRDQRQLCGSPRDFIPQRVLGRLP